MVDACENSSECANAFSTFFKYIGNKMAQLIPKVTCGDELPCERVPLAPFEFKHIDEEKIITNIMSLRGGLGPGWYGRVDPLKLVSKFISNSLRIGNQSFHSGCFPQSLKNSIVRPIFKSAEKNKITNNYRPISSISNVAKIVEKCRKKKMVHYLESNKILSKN